MATLTSVTQANPYNFFFGSAGGGGGGSSLLSPVAVVPDSAGNVQVAAIASSGAGDATLEVGSTNGNNATIQILNTPGGNSKLVMGQIGVPNGAVDILAPGLAGGGLLVVENNTSGVPYLQVDTITNNVVIASPSGPGIANGIVTINQPVIIRDSAGGSANAVALSPSSATASVISQTVASGGTLNVGSSLATPAIISLSDTGANTGAAVVGGNGGNGLFMTGGNAGATVFPGIRANAVNSGTTGIGSSVANPLTILARDGVAANSGFVEVTGGDGNSVAIRLQGANTAQPSATTTRISTNLGFGNAAVLNLTPSVNDVSPALSLQNGGSAANTILANAPIFVTSPISAFGASYTPILLRAPQISSGTFDVDLTVLPTGISLIYGHSSVSPPASPDEFIMFSVLVYTNPVDNVVGGGSINSSTRYEITPSTTNGKAITVNLGTISTANWAIYGITLLGL